MIYGVDIGSRRIAVVCLDPLHHAAIRLPKLRRGEAEDVGSALRQLAWWIQQNVPSEATLLVERPVAQHGPKANLRTLSRMSMTVGAILTAHAGPAHIVDNAVWKVHTVGSTRADKPTIAGWLADNHPALAAACRQDQDLVDATCIALAAPALVAAV